MDVQASPEVERVAVAEHTVFVPRVVANVNVVTAGAAS